MKVRLQMMIQDPRFAPVQGAKRRIEGYDVLDVPFVDGPATDRVVIEDVDAGTGEPVRFILPQRGRVLGHYDLPEPHQIDINAPAFNRVSVLATVLKTMELWEDEDVLGRPVRWNFPAAKLTVFPRMGIQENAFYKRDLAALEFYSFPSRTMPTEIVHTSLSRDVVAHETGHAILDGVAPQLLDASTSQSLAMHEAIGDISGLLIAVASAGLRTEVLAKTRGSIANANSFSAIAEQVGLARGTGALRDLRNTKRLADVNQNQPHSLSQVLTGALYAVFMRMHDKRWQAAIAPDDDAEARYSKSGKALWDARQHFKRMTLRALDYLPNGQVGFADYVRAIIAADQASHPDDTEERNWLKEEFVARGIIRDASEVTVTSPDVSFADVDLDLLVSDPAAAQAFVQKHRRLLGIPDGASFVVATPLKVRKKYYHRSDDGSPTEELVSECLVKASWSDPISTRRLGATLAIDWSGRKLRALLTSGRGDQPADPPVQPIALDELDEHLSALDCCDQE